MKYLDVASLTFDQDKCIICKRCLQVCPHQVFELESTIEMVHRDRCIECGACMMNCPKDAIQVNTGTGCATAVMYSYFKKHPVIGKFIK
jgi:Pyruvate/2-oxoacid:ferredoxin oxidoreductase delta subunit